MVPNMCWLLGQFSFPTCCVILHLSLIFLVSDSYHHSPGSLWYYLFLHVQNISSHEQKLILSKVNQKLKKKKSREIKTSKIHILQAMIVFRKVWSVEMKIILQLKLTTYLYKNNMNLKFAFNLNLLLELLNP